MRVAEELDFGKAEQIGKGSYVLRSPKTGMVFVKRQPPTPRTAIGRLIRRINGGSLPFANEELVHATLTEEDRVLLGIPRVLERVMGEYLVLEYLGNVKEVHPSDSPLGLAELIIAFNCLECNPRHPRWKWWQFRLLEAPLWRTLRVAIRFGPRYLGVWNALRVIGAIVAMELNERGNGVGVFLHNDINPNNVVMTSDSQLHIIDFEDSIRESKWTLVDIIDATFVPESLRLNTIILNEYLALAKKKGVLSPTLNLERQVRFALIRRVLLLLSFRRTPEGQKPALARFLTGILLRAESFSRWYSEQDMARALSEVN